jgi:hypothetical protein
MREREGEGERERRLVKKCIWEKKIFKKEKLGKRSEASKCKSSDASEGLDCSERQGKNAWMKAHEGLWVLTLTGWKYIGITK